MKHTIAVLFFILLGTGGHAQGIESAAALIKNLAGTPTTVNDPTNKVQLVKIVAEAKKSYAVVNEQLELLKKAREGLTKISNTLRTIRMIDDIAAIQGDIFEYQQAAFQAARELRVVNTEEIADIIGALNSTLIASESSLSLANNVLADGFFDMTTAERLEMLRETKRELQEQRATARYLDRQIRNYASLAFLENIYAKSSPSLHKATNKR